MLAYVFNLINGLTGVPSFPYYNVEGRLNVRMLLCLSRKQISSAA
jgi:hypothetical protein